MTQTAEREENLFMTCAILLTNLPVSAVKADPPSVHGEEEAIQKLHRFCHEIHHVPITWICTHSAMLRYADTLRGFREEYGDEIGVGEWGIRTRLALGEHPEEHQGWVEACGLSRPDDYVSCEPELIGTRGFNEIPYDETVTALAYLKSQFDEVLDQETRLFASPFVQSDTFRAMANVGFSAYWAYNWNYFCEGINNKGSLFYPFYPAAENHNAPNGRPDGNRVLGVHWGPFSPAIAYNVERTSRLGLPGYCLNALEMTNRSEGLDKYDYHRKLIREYAEQAKWNPYYHIPLQLEAVWADEAEPSDGRYEQFPAFNPSNTETFYTEVETALECGAVPLTISDFAAWHAERIGGTPEMVYFSEDHLPSVRNRGKDRAYEPFLLYGDSERQYWFDKSRGFNYIRKYEYAPPTPEAEIEEEYPFEDEPRVYLRVKTASNLQTGIVLTPDGASYEVSGFDLSAYADYPDYAAALWDANIPEYVSDDDLQIGGAVKRFRTIREKNLAIVFADLLKGLNPVTLRSDLPGRHIRMRAPEIVGRRCEIRIENDADDVRLHTLCAAIPPGLSIGGFWWDGRYSRTIFAPGGGGYDRETGALQIRAFYPVTLPVKRGLTRVSIELL